MYNMYEAVEIWSLCCEYMKMLIDKTCVQLFVMVLSSFICVYVQPSVYLVPYHMVFLRNICPPICIWLCDREKSSKSSDNVSDSYRRACVVLDYVDY